MTGAAGRARRGVRFRSVATIVSFAFFGGTLAAARAAAADEVRLENGDVIQGTIQGADEKTLRIQHAYGTVVAVPLEKVTSIRTDAATVVRLLDGSQIRGRIVPGPEPGTFAIETESAGRVDRVHRASVAGIGEPPPPVVWSGQVSLGVTITDGNTQSKAIVGSFNGARRSKDDILEAQAFYTYAETFGKVSTRRSFARMQYSYFVWSPLYLYVGGALEYDRLRDLNLRARGGGGVGYAWVDRPDLSLRTDAGVEYVNEDLRRAEDRNFAALRGALTFDWKPLDWLRFREHLEVFPDVEDFRTFVSHSETSLAFALWKGFGISLVAIWDHVQRPAPGRERNDAQYALTLTYAF